MSSIVINPSRKAENSIYLAFSVVIVTFLLYLAAGLNTGPEFVPDLLIVATASSLIGAALVYSSPDESIFHWLLKRKNSNEKAIVKVARFHVFTQYLLGSYSIATRRVRPPKEEASDDIDAVLDEHDLDTEIWKLRGAFWLILSLIPAGLIICSILNWNYLCIGFAILLVSIGVAVIIPSFTQYKRTSQNLSLLSQFQWFDELLTATRMTEITPTPSVSKFSLSLNGLSEAIYRGIRGSQEKQPENVKDVPSIVKPIVDKKSISPSDRRESSVSLNGTVSEEINASRETRRKFNFLLAEEAVWLRQLIQTGRWKLFSTRFQKLKSDIIEKARINQDALVDVFINEWLQCLKFNIVFHSFSEFRRLLFHMTNLNLVPTSNSEIISALLFPEEEEMRKPAIAFAYYKQSVPAYDEALLKINEMFVDYANYFARNYINSFGPPEEPLRIEEEIGFRESEIMSSTRQHVTIFENVDDAYLNSIKKQDYTLEEDSL